MNRTRIKFDNVPVGTEFFDPYSGEFWTKVNADAAKCPFDDGTDTFRVDWFAGTEIVEIETVANNG
jgi:hypothetical protein